MSYLHQLFLKNKGQVEMDKVILKSSENLYLHKF